MHRVADSVWEDEIVRVPGWSKSRLFFLLCFTVLDEQFDGGLWERDHTRTMGCLRFLPTRTLTRILLQSRQYRQIRFLEVHLAPAKGEQLSLAHTSGKHQDT